MHAAIWWMIVHTTVKERQRLEYLGHMYCKQIEKNGVLTLPLTLTQPQL